MTTDAVGYGLLGAGAFGRFCLEQYAVLPEVRLAAVADVLPQAARTAAAPHGMTACASFDEMLAHPAVDLIHIATPPTTHRELAVRALEAGKHVLCEKPLATTLDDAQAMVDAAERGGRILAVNLIMRYNPLAETVDAILQENLLGAPLHGFFENYAKDEPLGPEHWFWKRGESGGIFIEHGVHFFDLFRMWLGTGRIEAAQQVVRPGTVGLVEQVQATARYGTDVLVNFYHGFTQAERMDRQEFRILCERGTIRLFEWVPTAIEIDGLADAATLARLQALVPHAKTETLATYTEAERQVTSRHKPYAVDGRYRITGETGMAKSALYGHVLRALLADQVAAIRAPDHARRVTERHGVDSLAMAVRADTLAAKGAP